MPSGSPPSSRPYLSQDPSLVEARGTLRDALGGLRNLDQLLRSLRVGPKALTTVLPDVYVSCEPARLALQRLVRGLSTQLGNDTVMTALLDFGEPRFLNLQKAIGKASEKPMNARHRLELERTVGRAVPELDATLSLLDLLEEALCAPRIRLKLSEVLDEIRIDPDKRSEQPHVVATLAGSHSDVELVMQPRVAMRLFVLGINLNALGGERPTVTIDASTGAGCEVSFGTTPAPGRELVVARRAIVPPSVACLDSAVTKMGCVVARSGESKAFSVRWPNHTTNA